MSEPVLHVGPSAHGLAIPPGFETRPPARRGDVDDLVATREDPGVLIIADGTFHSFPSVGHAEIRTALERGWTVWGLCSMGAIRAAEMRSLGMRGFGSVYQMYVDDPDFDDDEVALLHASEPPYTPVSEPLVHIRSFLADLVARGILADEATTIDVLKNRWYGERTLGLLRKTLIEAGLSTSTVDRELADFARHRTKTADLRLFLETWDG